MNCPTPLDVFIHYERCVEALGALKVAIQLSFVAGTVLPTSRFVGMTLDEFHAAMESLQRELEIEIVLMLVASFEAMLQKDMWDRVSRKKKDVLSRKLRKWWHRLPQKQQRASIESLLDQWKKITGKHSHIIGRMKSLFLYRHWVAHGRYWVEKSGLGLVDPYYAWQIGKAVFDVLPDFEPLPSLGNQ